MQSWRQWTGKVHCSQARASFRCLGVCASPLGNVHQFKISQDLPCLRRERAASATLCSLSVLVRPGSKGVVQPNRQLAKLHFNVRCVSALQARLPDNWPTAEEKEADGQPCTIRNVVPRPVSRCSPISNASPSQRAEREGRRMEGQTKAARRDPGSEAIRTSSDQLA